MSAVADLIRDIQARDEAQPTTMEVILAYPGFHIMTLFYPLAHFLWRHDLRALARLWMAIGRIVTGIEIHPAARLGRNLFIDHGIGVVIGQTAIVGDDCRIYHGATLGGRGGQSGRPRHPVIGNDVVIGAGAMVLGRVTVGDHARIGAGALVTTDVPPSVTMIGNPARSIGPTPGACAYGLPEGDFDGTTYFADNI